MSDRRCEVVILGEDRQQLVFLHRFLRGIDRNGRRFRNYREIPPPAGAGSGEQFVRTRYPVELRAHRSRAARAAVKLAVLIDADNYTVTERHRHLVMSLTDSQLTDRTDAEAVAILIPRRNIETWIHYLMGKEVDEVETYPKLRRGNVRFEGDCQPAVDRLLEWYTSGWSTIPDDCPDSLRRGIEELKRIL